VGVGVYPQGGMQSTIVYEGVEPSKESVMQSLIVVVLIAAIVVPLVSTFLKVKNY